MDGGFYLDQRTPFITADIPAVTLAATNKALYPVGNFPVLGSNYWGFPGKAIRVAMFGRMSTGATPGNGQFALYWGTGADANGTIIAQSGAIALVANAVSLSWCAEFIIRCRSTGSSGTLFGTGWIDANVGLILSTNAPMLVPANLPAVSAALDLTLANIVSVQFNRSGSTAESMQIHEMSVTSLN